MPIYIKTILLLVISNIFMTFAWYAHLKILHNKALWFAIIVSWSIAFFEYLFQVPANRLGFNSGTYSLAQLKILQEALTLLIFIPFAPFRWIISAVAALLIGFGMAGWMNSKLGGVNGDVLGASAVAAEIVSLAVFAI